ncbi:ATP-dependent dethiobiotin synthetase BioD [Polyangium jinanense]|uniref:ATP-dependent dethiobiotin synthetase BioD n=1 Tax=Polyangium jinanense TaxID=2829994 RepID=A0A9X3X4A7_9BACT|nr:dethiobiotin synthase [Polyangium jinanense]MDC3952214.1 dethiobiotin synthase [Polyangium jinanense]MDC3956359.1 dethiobiotin synthase [Polyangium jinanense]MDC3979842.1 dethiobiotin synthase [Polyangium jinanense]MDC3982495.1 dethiobiotin synthase [Polyangium jinanense]
MSRIVVIGTGTGVGKTHAGVALVAALASARVSVAGLKPIESGVPSEPSSTIATDASALAAFSTFHVKHPLPYALPDPVSPHLAARRLGMRIDLGRVAEWVDAHACAEVLVIETAGALLSPLGPGLVNLDLARVLRPDHLLLVASDRLGVLHDVAVTLHALRTMAADLPAPLLVLQPPAVPDASTGTNAEELVELKIVPRLVVFPRAETTAEETRAAAKWVLSTLALEGQNQKA